MKAARNYTAPYDVNSFRQYLSETNLTLCTCWKLVSKTNVTVGATSHTRDLTLSNHAGVNFLASQGVVPSAVDNEMGLGSAGLEVDAVFSVNVLTEESIAAGDWDGAYFEVFLVNYLVPEMGELVMFAGTIGEVKTYGERFRAEGRPLTSKATQQIGSIYTEKCVVRRLGDGQCKLTVTVGSVAYDGGVITTTGTVTTGGSNTQFIDSSRTETTGYYSYGTVKFTSGPLSGRQSEIVQHIGTTGGTSLRMGTDTSWKCSTTLESGWETEAFDDSAWTSAFAQGTNGSVPWSVSVAGFPADSTAQFIWPFDTRYSTTSGDAYFRKTFTPNVASAVITITGDNEYEIYLNDVLLGSGNEWRTSENYSLALNVGVPNTIAIKGVNLSNGGAINPAGILADIAFASYNPSSSGGTIQLSIPMPRNIDAGTTYEITRGCDRAWKTCKNVFNNLVNIRAVPFVPGIERAYKTNTT